jgi:hypothetical protein
MAADEADRLDLLAATSRFDGPTGVTAGSGPIDFALIAFAVRARRLMRPAYRLLDAGEPDGASVLFRVMSEYIIVGRWLIKNGEEAMTRWAINDLRERRNILVEMLTDPRIAPDHRGSLEGEMAATEEAIGRYGGSGTPLSKSAAARAGVEPIPSLKAMAHEVDMDFAYSFGYRLQSQTDAHATPLSIDAAFEERNPAEPGPRIRPIPRHALQGFDLYAAGAFFLLDVLGAVSERISELDWEQALVDVRGRLSVGRAGV